MKTSKTRFIPENAVERIYPEANATIYRYNTPNSFAFLIYKGRQTKPARHEGYRSDEIRENVLGSWLKKATEAHARKLERQEVEHGLEVGDVVFTTWGYEQTNADFFQVVRVPSGRSAVVREIDSAITEKGFMSGDAVPKIDCFAKGSEEVLRRAAGLHTITGGRNYRRLRKWDGKPVGVSWYG